MRTLGMPTTSEFMGTHPLKDCKPIQAETFKRAAPLLIVVFYYYLILYIFSFGFSLFCVVLRVSSQPPHANCPSGGTANPCSGHGTCDDGSSGTGLCTCDDGYAGANCSIACAGGVLSPCSGHGTCSPATGTCTCQDNALGHYSGTICSTCVRRWSRMFLFGWVGTAA